MILQRLWTYWLLWAGLFCVGCTCSPFSKTPGPAAPYYPETPKELQKTVLPDYVIEPPDVLTIDAINLIPLAPYHLRPLDRIIIQAAGLPEQAPLAAEYLINVDGTIVLGSGYDNEGEGGPYSPLQVTGLTLAEVQQLVRDRLSKFVAQFDVWVTLSGIASQQEIAGEHLVAPDGTVNLGTYGRVRVVGMTLEQAKSAIEHHLSSRFTAPEVAVDVYGYNSKVYYVVTQGAGLGDRVIQLPVTGGETALDAISQVQGLSGTSSTRIWIARPGANEQGGDQILPVDWLSVTQRGDVATNYQIMPGDRVYIAEDKLVALDTALGKLFSPFERVFGVTLLGTQTAKQIRFYDVPNTGGGGF